MSIHAISRPPEPYNEPIKSYAPGSPEREEWDRVVGAIDRLLVLDPKAATEWRDRGVAWSNLGEVRRGLGDWERYLTEFPDAEDHETVKGHLRRARQKLAQLN